MIQKFNILKILFQKHFTGILNYYYRHRNDTVKLLLKYHIGKVSKSLIFLIRNISKHYCIPS